jgi:hypothetical protein
MMLTPRVVPRRAVARGQLDRQAAGDQRLERLVDGRQTDLGDHHLDGLINFLCRRVVRGVAEVIVDREPLGRAAPAGRLQDGPQAVGIELG